MKTTKLEPAVIGHASEIYTATIAAHYHHGLPAGERLNFQIIAGESVEAALRFAEALAAEEDHASITRVMRLNDAQRAGYIACKEGMPPVAPEEYKGEYATAWSEGYNRAQ